MEEGDGVDSAAIDVAGEKFQQLSLARAQDKLSAKVGVGELNCPFLMGSGIAICCLLFAVGRRARVRSVE